MEAPLVSVIMNCFNGAKYLKEAIDSIVNQTYSNWEIIFFDNASTDGSGEIACRYGNKLKYFRGEQTISLGAARNAAISYANGKYVAFLDTDDQWLPEKLSAQVKLMQAHPGAVLCYSNVLVLNETTGKTNLSHKGAQPSGSVFGAFLRYYPVNLQTVLVRKDGLMNMAQIFDPRFEVVEEYDVFIRILYGAEAIYLDAATAIYRVHPKMTSIRKNDLFPVEHEAVLDKLSQSIPDFECCYRKELRYLRAKVAYWYAVSLMAKGEKTLARSRLRPHKYVAIEFLMLFLITFFPAAVWRYVLSSRTLLGARQ